MKINKKNQFQIGETFQFGLIRLKCVISEKGGFCIDCYFSDIGMNCDKIKHIIGCCSFTGRYDLTGVIFKKVTE